MLDLTAAFLRGKNAISEIASIQRTYGQISLLDYRININGVIVKPLKPTDSVSVNEMKEGKSMPVNRMLFTYLQASVDNAKYLLLDKWNYSRDSILKKLWVTEDGTELDGAQLKVVKILHSLHGLNGKVKRGKDHDLGIYTNQEMIIQSQEVLSFIEDREAIFLSAVEKELNTPDMMVNLESFNSTIIPSQEQLASQPARVFNSIPRAGMDNSPFLFLGHDDLHGTPNIYKRVFDVVKEEYTEPELEILEKAVKKEDLKAATNYITEMGSEFYGMFEDFAEKGTDPGFLGWSNNETMANFATKWHNKFTKLSPNAKKVATLKFLNGVKKRNGKNTSYVFSMPPISKRVKGITLLDPKVMEKYFKMFHEQMNNKEFIDQDTILANSNQVGLVTHILKNC